MVGSMGWFNYYGLIIMVAIIVPNIVACIKNKDAFKNSYENKAAAVFEQVGRYGCFALMIFNIPYTWIGFYLTYGEVFYLAVNATLSLAYCAVWAIMWNKSGIVKCLLLSVIPSIIFLFSGIMILSIPLIVFSIIFAVCHILISVKNVKCADSSNKTKKKSVVTVTALLLSVVLVFLSTFGGLTIYSQTLVNNLENMSCLDMIEYDCKAKGVKISVAIVEDGVVTYHTYGGNGEESEIYKYEIGSVSKTFVGLLCAKAVSEGKLKLTDSIAQYLELSGEKYYPTIERLLTHTSGYDAYYLESCMVGNKFAQISNDFYGTSKDMILKKAESISLEDKDYPFVYSNFGISVVGLVLEKIYKATFTDLMNNYIRDELHLTDTAVASQSGNLSGYWKWKETDGYIPAGAIISDIKDMASYLNIYLNGNISYVEETYAKLKDINANAGTSEKFNIRVDAIGMTWILDEENDIVWHNGATTNFNSYVGFTKDGKKGVAVLGNLNSSDRVPMSVIGAKLLLDGLE
jgi:CubicO group peptidase (beta-lactamase class C family)